MNQSYPFSLFAFITLVILIGSSCASKRYTKKAVKFEEAGLYEDAANYYYLAIKKKASNVEAKLGLHKTGQQTLDNKLQKVKDAYKQSDFEEVVYYYMDVKAYNDKIRSAGVELTYPKIYDSYYSEAKNDFLNTLYSDGTDKLKREEFSSAEKIFQEIINIEDDYRDVYEKYITAKYEPIYRNANTYLENDLYRKAYYAYDKVLRGAGNYKQALTLKNEAQEKGTISIIITDFGFSNSSYKQTANTVTSGLTGELSKLDNPFITIIDDASSKEGIYKNGSINMHSAHLLGVKAILSGKILAVKKQNGRQTKEVKRGYLKVINKTRDREGNEISTTEYKKTEYTQYHAENHAELHVEFTLVSTENGEVLVSSLYKLNEEDELNYVKFDGNKNDLIPGYWKSRSYKSKQDVVKDNYGDVTALRRLLNASRTIVPASSLLEELLDSSVSKITNKIDDYNPEK